MPIGNLPPKAAKLFDEVYRRYLSGECEKDKECASKRAWGAVKNAGYFKGKDGKWHKKSDVELSMAEMSLYISKASFDKKTQEMRWSAVASDTDRDDYDERMSIELYNDFIRRAVEGEEPPEELCSDAWCGGMPYLSLSHYPDLNGKGVIGPTTQLYVDGKMLKGRGTFSDTDLGRACFKSICEDLYSEERSDNQEKIRISIGFIDWAHYHGDFKFERKSLTDRCPMCALGVGDRMFAKGHLLHLALTRIPVNTRTDILPIVEESMVTQKEDAESIVGEELSDTLDKLYKEEQLVGKSEAVVERADDDEEMEEEKVEEESVESENLETPEEEVAELEVADSPVEEVEQEAEETEMQVLSSKVEALLALVSPKEKESHPLDTVFESIRSQFDEVIELDLTADEKLQLLQDPYAELGNVLRSGVDDTRKQEAGEQPVIPVDVVTKSELAAVLDPLTEQISLLVARMDGSRSGEVIRNATPQRRSIPSIIAKKAVVEEKPGSLSAIARRSTGITSY
jgi:hypothetical protein